MSTIAANPWVVKVHANKGMIFPLAFISLLLVILVPLPTFVLDFLKSNGFNALRVPLSLPMIMNNPMPSSIDYSLNPNLQGKTALQVLGAQFILHIFLKNNNN